MKELLNSSPLQKILFVSHKQAQCGVYEFGKNVCEALQRSQNYQFIRVECSSMGELRAEIKKNDPAAIIYNYHPAVLPWVATRIGGKLWKNNIASIKIPQIGIMHEVTQQIANMATGYRNKLLFGAGKLCNSLFDFYISSDPTLLLKNPLVYKTCRLLPSYDKEFTPSVKPVIGSFGFATPKKGFEKIVQLVQQEFDEAVIRFNIPAADFGDKNGINARTISERCKALIDKPGIELVITHDFLNGADLLNFLAQNTANVFLYEDENGRGISSAVDIAMAVRRPVAVSEAKMFRHVLDVKPSICVKNNSLKQIIQNGFAPLQSHYDEWSAENLLWEYERILRSIFLKLRNPETPQLSILGSIRAAFNKLLSKPDNTFTWLINSEKITEDSVEPKKDVRYQPVQIPAGNTFNRILDNKARELYKPAVDKLFELMPETMAEKISEANVQQAFVFDTVYRNLVKFKNPKILCVGSYKDTASMSLKVFGLHVDEIDPNYNYYLQEFYTKPTTKRASYDIIFSTSVIEHDSDDESFVKCIEGLLAPGGIAIITCDYQDGWKPGEPKPECNARFYTQNDLKNRLLPLMEKCQLIDEPQWDCPDPDFNYLGIYKYTFATFVVCKKS